MTAALADSLPTPRVSAKGRAALRAFLDESVDSGRFPAQFHGIASADDVLYWATKGERVHGEPDKGQVDDDTTVELWSMTKVMTSIACIQLHERGVIDLYDPGVIDKYAPELAKQPILKGYTSDGPEGTPIYVERTRPMTLAHLLSHSAGIGYGALIPLLGRWERENNLPSWNAKHAVVEAYCVPLLAEPGECFMYGYGIDWAGIIVWRATGQTLEEYFAEHIYKPCGLKSITFYPRDDVRKRLMQLCGRDEAGDLVHIDGFRPVPRLRPEDIGVLSGGGGTIGPLREYLAFLQHILRCRDREGGILSPAGFKLLFTNALPPRDEQPQVYKQLGEFLGSFGHTDEGMVSGRSVAHSVGLCLIEEDAEFGRRAPTGWWGGAAKTEYWIDPESNVIGLFGTNLLDKSHPMWIEEYIKYQKQVYAALEESL